LRKKEVRYNWTETEKEELKVNKRERLANRAIQEQTEKKDERNETVEATKERDWQTERLRDRWSKKTNTAKHYRQQKREIGKQSDAGTDGERGVIICSFAFFFSAQRKIFASDPIKCINITCLTAII
jgi:hypothetical protein